MVSCSALLSRCARLASLALLALASCATTRQEPSPAADTRPGHLFSVLVGGRSMDDDVAWDEIDSPIVLGFEGGNFGDPLGYEFGASIAFDSTEEAGVDVTDRFLELFAGGRAIFGEGKVLPYLGAGLAVVSAEVEGDSGLGSASDDDVSLGFYGHGGVLVKVARSFYLGLDARLLTGTEVDLFSIETDVDYVQLAAVFAWGG